MKAVRLPRPVSIDSAGKVGAASAGLSGQMEQINQAARQASDAVSSTAAAIEERPIGELSARREEFRTLDRSRYTLFLLETPQGTLTPVRTSVRIRDPLAALLLWDETGSAVVYYSEAYA